MNFYPLFYKSILLIYIFIGGCVTTPKILFEDPVDTKNKRISIQEKKTFSFEQAGVYFSNDFLGARLNNVIKKTAQRIKNELLVSNVKINNLEKNPTKGGTPAIENNRTVMAKTKKLLKLKLLKD